MDAVAYPRFSSENQNDLSLEAQISGIKDAAYKNGDEIIAVYEERGESGRTADREKFMEMFNDIKTGKLKVKRVYVYTFSRFMRNPNESRFFKLRLEALGVDVISAMQPLPEEQYMADFMEGVIELTDKLTSDMIGIHVRSGMEELARRGYWTGGPPPFGYDIMEIDSREGHIVKGEIIKRAILVPNEGQAAIVRRIFEIAATTDVGGQRLYQILCQELGRDVLGSKGQKLGGRGVNAILRKPIYKGVFVYGGHGYKLMYDENPSNERRMRKARVRRDGKAIIKQIEEWRLVSDEIWEAAQRNRMKNIKKDFGHGPKKAAFLLTGLIHCGVCGNSVGGHWQQNRDGGNRYHYYRCRNAMHGITLCNNKAKIRGSEIESVLVAMIEQELFSDSFLNGLIDEIIALKRQQAKQTDRPALERRRQELSAKIGNLARAAAIAIDVPEIGQQLAELNRERVGIDQVLAADSRAAIAIDAKEIKVKVDARLGKTLDLLKTPADMDQLRLELKKWIDAIRVDADGKVWVKWNAKAVFDLLDLGVVSLNGEEGSPLAVKRYCLSRWNSIAPATTNRSKPISASGFMPPTVTRVSRDISGFAGFSGALAG